MCPFPYRNTRQLEIKRCAKITDSGVERVCAFASIPVACAIGGSCYVVCKNPTCVHRGKSMKARLDCKDFHEIEVLEDSSWLGFGQALKDTVRELKSEASQS